MICLLCFSVVQRLGRFASSSQCEICNFPKKTAHTDAFSIRAWEWEGLLAHGGDGASGVLRESPGCQRVPLTVQVWKGTGEVGLPQASWGGLGQSYSSAPSCGLCCALIGSRPAGPHLCSLLVPSASCNSGCRPARPARHVTFGPPSLPPCDPHVASGEAETNPQISPLGTFQRQRHQRGGGRRGSGCFS